MKIKAMKRLLDSLAQRLAKKKVADLDKYYKKLIDNLVAINEQTLNIKEKECDERVNSIQKLVGTQTSRMKQIHSNEIKHVTTSHEKNRTELQEIISRFEDSNEIQFEIDQLYKNHIQELYDELRSRRKASEELISLLIKSNAGIDEMTKEFEIRLRSKRKRLSNKLNIGT